MNTQPSPGVTRQVAQNPPNRPPIASAELLRGASTVEIEHAGQRYLLRVTRENKLILTK